MTDTYEPIDVEVADLPAETPEIKTGVVLQIVFPDDEITGVYPIDFEAITSLVHLEQALFHGIKTLPDAVWNHLKANLLKEPETTDE